MENGQPASTVDDDIAALKASYRGVGNRLWLLVMAGALVFALPAFFDYAGAVEHDYSVPWSEEDCAELRRQCGFNCDARADRREFEQCVERCLPGLHENEGREACWRQP